LVYNQQNEEAEKYLYVLNRLYKKDVSLADIIELNQ